MIAPIRRRLVPFDVIRVRPGAVEGRRLDGVLLTVMAVSEDGQLVDCTEWTGGPVMHLLACDCCAVTPVRGEVTSRG